VSVRAEDLDDEEWPFTGHEIHGLIAWARGRGDRNEFRRGLQARHWPAQDIDDLTRVVEHILTVEAREP